MLIIVTYHLGEDLQSREGRALSKYYARPGLHHTQAIWMEIIKKLRPQPYIGIWSESKFFARWYYFCPVVQKAPVALSPILPNELACSLVQHPSCHVLGLKVAIATWAQHQSPQSTHDFAFQHCILSSRSPINVHLMLEVNNIWAVGHTFFELCRVDCHNAAKI